jgi:hypothetical protein
MTSLRTAGDPVDILEYESANCAPTPACYVLESLSFIRHHPMKAYGGGEVWLHTFICRMIRRIGNALVSYSGGAGFESRMGKQLS